MPKETKDQDGQSQIQKSKELAREVGADMDTDEFDGLLEGTRRTMAPTKEEAFQAQREGKAD